MPISSDKVHVVIKNTVKYEYCDTRERDAVSSGFASAPHPDPESRLSSATQDFSFLSGGIVKVWSCFDLKPPQSFLNSSKYAIMPK